MASTEKESVTDAGEKELVEVAFDAGLVPAVHLPVAVQATEAANFLGQVY